MRHQKTCSFDGRIDAIRFYNSNQNSKSPIEQPLAKRKRIEETNDTEEEDSDDSAAWRNRGFVYYSMEHLVLYISELRRLESNMALMHESNRLLYTKLMEPFLTTWCTMALTAAPVTRRSGFGSYARAFYLDYEPKFIDQVTHKCRAAQSALCVAHTRFMSQFKRKFPLSGA